jgi:hypothetical protein
MQLKSGQRWRYRDSQYIFVVEIKDATGFARIVQTNGFSRIGSAYDVHISSLISKDNIFFASQSYWTAGAEFIGGYSWEYLPGQDKCN